MTDCTKACSVTSCPFAYTDESEQIQSYGCLPTPREIRIMRVDHGKTWACHSNPRKPCLGALLDLQKNGLPHKVIDCELLTENHPWHLYANPIQTHAKEPPCSSTS